MQEASVFSEDCTRNQLSFQLLLNGKLKDKIVAVLAL